VGTEHQLTAAHEHTMGTYRADSAAAPRAGCIVLQECFGVTAHIREVCDGHAAYRFVAPASALYDGSSMRDRALGYGAADAAIGRPLREEFCCENTVKNVASVLFDADALWAPGSRHSLERR
jgi:carboxymethylenebutenolidase